MASSSQAPESQDVRAAVAKVKSLLNRHLIAILKDARLTHTGTKSVMQARMISYLENLQREGNGDKFNRIRSLIYNPESLSASGGSPRSGPHFHAGSIVVANGYGGMTSYPASSSVLSGNLSFKDSPFFTILEALTSPQRCPVMQSHRHTVSTPLRLRKDVVERLNADPAIRVMVYCASDGPLVGCTKLDISFPHQIELKVNHEEVKANVRGLKNKPGSTRPVDITAFLRKAENYENTFAMTYALTQKIFSFVVNLVKTHSVDELVDVLRKGKIISKEKVILEMQSRAQDADIVTTSTIMSLKCPLSYLRMALPCRSTVCSHHQCFDAASFLQLQEQAPQWTCPICYKIISFEALVVDQYVKDILNSTPKSLEQVTIEPNGEWSQNTTASPSAAGSNNINSMIQADEIDDDDLLELQSSVVKNNINNISKTSTPSAPNRVVGSNGMSGSVSRSTSSKRPMGSVIDLTLSDDEDDEGSRPAKRQATMESQNTPSGGGAGMMVSMMMPGQVGGATSGATNGNGNGNLNGFTSPNTAVNYSLPFFSTSTTTTPKTDGIERQHTHTGV